MPPVQIAFRGHLLSKFVAREIKRAPVHTSGDFRYGDSRSPTALQRFWISNMIAYVIHEPFRIEITY